MKDLSRNVTMNCATCGNDQFEYDKDDDNSSYKCSDCGREYTKSELFEANEYKINKNIGDIKDEALDKVEKELKKMFKKFR